MLHGPGPNFVPAIISTMQALPRWVRFLIVCTICIALLAGVGMAIDYIIHHS